MAAMLAMMTISAAPAQPLPDSDQVTLQSDSVVILVDNGETMKLPCGAGTRHDMAVSLLNQVMAVCPDGIEITVATLHDSSPTISRSTSLTAEDRRNLVSTLDQLTPGGTTSFRSCLQSEDMPWSRYQTRHTTFVVIGDGLQCGLDDPDVIRLARKRFGSRNTVIVLGTCHDTDSSLILNRFAASCRGFYSQCDALVDVRQQLTQLIARLGSRDDAGPNDLMPVLLAIQSQQTELFIKLSDRLEQQRSEFNSIAVKSTAEWAAIQHEFSRLTQSVEAVQSNIDSMRDILIRMDSTTVHKSDLVLLKEHLTGIETKQTSQIEDIKRTIDPLATSEQLTVVSSAVNSLRHGSASDDQESLRSISNRLNLLNRHPPAPNPAPDPDSRHATEPWWIVLLSAAGCGVCLLLARLFGFLPNRNDIERICLHAERRSERICLHGSMVGGCRYVPSHEKPVPPPEPDPDPDTDDPLTVTHAAPVEMPRTRQDRSR